jgi:bifunctional ADP-heptose synthase (sugar kinase/adenylyltransferase)
MLASSKNKNWSNPSVAGSTSPTGRSTAQLSSLLADISGYKVLLIGDAIYDEYVYVRPQGKSPKENIISNKVLDSESFRGGVWAAQAHISAFVRDADVYSFSRSGTIRKRRYVEQGYIRKLFETHEAEASEPQEEPSFSDYDLVVVTDFGHGVVTPNLIENMIRGSRFLAVNAQTNSANHGFNLITKYRHADYVVVDELEARLAAHDRDSKIEDVILKLGFKRIIVTLGPNGAIGYDGDFHRSPGFTRTVVDTMGAGDAFFCVTAPFAAAGAEMPELLRIGNAAGAIKCGVVGHRTSVDRDSLVAYLNI